MPKTKKPKPRPEIDAHTYGYMLDKPYAKPRYFKDWKAGRAAIVTDILGMRDGWELLRADDAVAACNALLKQTDSLPLCQTGSVEGVVDPESGVKYKATLVRREQI